MKFIFATLLFTLISIASHAQFSEAYVKITAPIGSPIAKNTVTNFKKLKFVKNVQFDLDNNVCKIYFVANEKPEMDELVKAVTQAGASVGYLKAVFNFNNPTLSAENCFTYQNDTYQISNFDKNKKLNGELTVTFIGAGFMPKADWTKMAKTVGKECQTKTGKSYMLTIQ